MSRDFSISIKQTFENFVKSTKKLSNFFFILAVSLLCFKPVLLQAYSVVELDEGDSLIVELAYGNQDDVGHEQLFNQKLELSYIEKGSGVETTESFVVLPGQVLVFQGVEKGTLNRSSDTLNLENLSNVSGAISLQNTENKNIVYREIENAKPTTVSFKAPDGDFGYGVVDDYIKISSDAESFEYTIGDTQPLAIYFVASPNIAVPDSGNDVPEQDPPEDPSVNQDNSNDELNAQDQMDNLIQTSDEGDSIINTGAGEEDFNNMSGCSLSLAASTSSSSHAIALLGLFLSVPAVIRLKKRA